MFLDIQELEINIGKCHGAFLHLKQTISEASKASSTPLLCV
jgi:hypothetical protein